MAKDRFLKLGDMKSREEYLAERQNYTDEQARKIGYPSADVLRLSDELTQIAGQWRRTKADDLVLKYRQTLYEMILKGYNVDTLPVQDQLPEELMPELPPQIVRSAITQAYKELLAE